MATYKNYSMGGVMPTNRYKAKHSNQNSGRLYTVVDITAWGMDSWAGCAENNGIAMKQGAEVTMHR